MGDYTSVELVRRATGYSAKNSPSGTVNFCIRRGEAAMKKYLGIDTGFTPASGSSLETWVEDAATSFAAHYLALRLASQNVANVVWQRQAQTSRSSEFIGQSLNAEMWWNSAIRICDMHGRQIVLERISPSS